jgi:hypothetical protein
MNPHLSLFSAERIISKGIPMSKMKSVVTPERFSSGMTYKEYIGQIDINKERFEEFYKNCKLTDEDDRFFNRAAKMPDGARKIMVIGEAWCPDVMRGMPAAARVAEAAGMELKVFPRDKNLDIMNEFLKEGKFQSIPVMVFYTDDMQELGRWIERPGLASSEQAKFTLDITKADPNIGEQEIRLKMRDFTQSKQAGWQQESIREWRQMLAGKLGI